MESNDSLQNSPLPSDIIFDSDPDTLPSISLLDASNYDFISSSLIEPNTTSQCQNQCVTIDSRGKLTIESLSDQADGKNDSPQAVTEKSDSDSGTLSSPEGNDRKRMKTASFTKNAKCGEKQSSEEYAYNSGHSSESEYLPSEQSESNESSSENDAHRDENNPPNKDQNETFTIPSAENSTDKPVTSSLGTDPVFYEKLIVDKSQGPDGKNKKNFCYYCNKLQSKIARHLERVHSEEAAVKKFIALPKKERQRLKIIDTIRRQGNFAYNTNPLLNKDGKLIPLKRPSVNSGHVPTDYVPCPDCTGFVLKNKLSTHFRECAKKPLKGARNVQVLGRRLLGRIHPVANDKLKKIVFPVLREDDVVANIRFDELIILFGNYLCDRLVTQQTRNLIRSKLRLLGRFMIEMRSLDPRIDQMILVFHPSKFDLTVTTVKAVAEWDDIKGTFAKPTTATDLCTTIKQVGETLITKYIKESNKTKKEEVEDFLKLCKNLMPVIITKNAIESREDMRRRKKVTLPTLSDISKLKSFLDRQREESVKALELKFSFTEWKACGEALLTSIQLFNRRRSGEVERMLLEDFESYESIKEVDKDLYDTLGANSRKIADQYVRFCIRGKLGRTVPVLLSKDLLTDLQMFIRLRRHAGVSSKNPYVFGLPGNDVKTHKYLSACALMRKFSIDCGAEFAYDLRGTKLRKHIATQCVKMNLNEVQTGEVANYMGHHKDIHKERYRQSLPAREILQMTNLLEKAGGMMEKDNDGSEGDSDIISPAEENNDSLVEESEIAAVGNEDTGSVDTPNMAAGSSRHSPARNRRCETTDTSDTDSEDEDSSHKRKQVQRKKGSGRPTNKGMRRRWTDEEVGIISKAFAMHLRNFTLPSFKSIQEVVDRHPILKTRTVAQIKAWVNNHNTKELKNRKKARV